MADEEQNERDEELEDDETSSENEEAGEEASSTGEEESPEAASSTADAEQADDEEVQGSENAEADASDDDGDEAETEAKDEEEDDEVEEDEDDADVEVSSSDEDTSRQQEEQGGDGQEEFEESVVHVNRCCKVVQGGKVFSFSALVVAGNRNGKISYGFGKANQVPQAIQKAIQDSRERVIDVPIVHGTIPHRVELEYCSTDLLLRPASPGTGVIASLPVRTTVNLAGITDLLTKIYGSTNPINCVKAVYEGLKSLRTKEEIEELRDVKIT